MASKKDLEKQVKDTTEILAFRRRQMMSLEYIFQQCFPPGKTSRFLSLAFTAMQTGRHWIGRASNTLGTKDPYPESRDPKSARIEPTYDVKQEYDEATINRVVMMSDKIAQLKWLRGELQLIGTALTETSYTLESSVSEFRFVNRTLWEAYAQVMQAGHWLGEELGSMRKVPLPEEPAKEEAGDTSLLDKLPASVQTQKNSTDFEVIMGNFGVDDSGDAFPTAKDLFSTSGAFKYNNKWWFIGLGKEAPQHVFGPFNTQAIAEEKIKAVQDVFNDEQSKEPGSVTAQSSL